MRRVILAVVLAAAGLAIAPPAHAASDPTFDTITWGRSSLSASGTAMTLQTLSVHVTDPRQYPGSCWEFSASRTGGTGTLADIWSIATLVAGSDADGVWSTSFYVPSTADGAWSLTTATDCGDTGVTPTFGVPSSPIFTVTGTHQPRISWRHAPSPVPLAKPYVTVTGRVYDADTGAGVSGVQVGRAEDSYCLGDFGDTPTELNELATTGANGYFTIASSRDNPRALQCIGVYGTPRTNPDGYAVFVWSAEMWFHYVPGVSATPASSRVRSGTIDNVNGTVIGTTHCPIELQRLHGSTAWRTVGTSDVRTSGRFTLSAQPPGVGRFVYRAYYPAHCDRYPQQQDAASSKPVRISGM